MIIIFVLVLGPGVSSCIYYGMVAEYSCYTTAVPLDKLPDCTSFVFESLGIDENHVVSQDFNDGYDGNLAVQKRIHLT